MTIKIQTFIIAEAGVNHNGSLDRALRLIDAAADAGADAVKFQTFRAEALVSRHAPKAEYQTRTTDAAESQIDMIRKLELSEADHQDLIAHAKAQNIQFLSTPFDAASLQLLTERLGLTTIKISSGEITNAPFMLKVARCARKIILSTGMSTLAEVEAALSVLAFGFVAEASAVPAPHNVTEAYATAAGQEALRERVTLLHCTTEYPAPVAEVNLRAMDTLAAAFGLAVGYSDHTQGIHIPVAAVARGAGLVEKHFTLDRNLPGPDHKASLVPGELRQMVCAIRDVEQAMGDGVKCPTASEWKNRDVARKSLVAARPIAAGEIFTPENLTCKRPGTGRTPFDFWSVCGQSASRNFSADEPV